MCSFRSGDGNRELSAPWSSPGRCGRFGPFQGPGARSHRPRMWVRNRLRSESEKLADETHRFVAGTWQDSGGTVSPSALPGRYAAADHAESFLPDSGHVRQLSSARRRMRLRPMEARARLVDFRYLVLVA